MLQQTQVATVIPYFERFVAALPDTRSLAAAPEEVVLRLWEGLGYYRRARQLHRAALEVVERHDGVFPHDLEAIRALPGIGRYTAGAIASIAFDAPAPILEANTIRLLSRLLAFDGDPASSAGQAYLWDAAAKLTPRRGAGVFNQALMELGSLVCSPREPNCSACPAQRFCGARRAGRERELPRPRAKTAITPVHEAAIVIRRGARVFLRQCGAEERWAGLWDFPRFGWSGRDEAQAELAERTQELTGLDVTLGRPLATLTHGVTRFRITLRCFAAEWRSGRANRSRSAASRWARPDELESLPLNTTGRKISRLLDRS